MIEYVIVFLYLFGAVAIYGAREGELSRSGAVVIAALWPLVGLLAGVAMIMLWLVDELGDTFRGWRL